MNEETMANNGLAVDIDETLSWTFGHWIAKMQESFGNPEGLTVTEMAEKYRLVQNVPYWQHNEALEWVAQQINSNEGQETLPLIEGSVSYLKRINEIIPVAAYITVRPQSVIEGTKNWLEKHGFPAAPVICRPKDIDHVDGNKWKAQTLEGLYPKIIGIIDDNAKLLQFLSPEYKGKVFLYDHQDNLGYPYAVACKEWIDVYNQVELFAKEMKVIN